MREACVESADVGTDCFCWLNGVTPTDEPLPAGCMEAAQIVMAVPSSLKISTVVHKPENMTQEVCPNACAGRTHLSPAALLLARRWC